MLVNGRAKGISDGVAHREGLGKTVGLSQGQNQIIGCVVGVDQTHLVICAVQRAFDILRAAMLVVGSAAGAEIAAVIKDGVGDPALTVLLQTIQIDRDDRIFLGGNGYLTLGLPQDIAVGIGDPVADRKCFTDTIVLLQIEITVGKGSVRGEEHAVTDIGDLGKHRIHSHATELAGSFPYGGARGVCYGDLCPEGVSTLDRSKVQQKLSTAFLRKGDFNGGLALGNGQLTGIDDFVGDVVCLLGIALKVHCQVKNLGAGKNMVFVGGTFNGHLQISGRLGLQRAEQKNHTQTECCEGQKDIYFGKEITHNFPLSVESHLFHYTENGIEGQSFSYISKSVAPIFFGATQA